MATDALTGPGAYALLIELDRACDIAIGRRGTFRFPAGFYLYAGSALGPGGLAKRLARHLRADKRLHWHIDYLLHATGVFIREAWTVSVAARHECDWASAAAQLPGASIVVPRFGASDCRCAAHLVGFAELPDMAAFSALVGGPAQRRVIRCLRG